jgi:hypothetical protein
MISARFRQSIRFWTGHSTPTRILSIGMGLNPRQRGRLRLVRKRRFHIVLWVLEISYRTDKLRLHVGRLR